MRADPPPLNWRKSSYSGGTGDCVEVARDAAHVVLRDSKAPATGHLTLSDESFAQLVHRAKCGELDI